MSTSCAEGFLIVETAFVEMTHGDPRIVRRPNTHSHEFISIRLPSALLLPRLLFPEAGPSPSHRDEVPAPEPEHTEDHGGRQQSRPVPRPPRGETEPWAGYWPM